MSEMMQFLHSVVWGFAGGVCAFVVILLFEKFAKWRSK